MAGKTRLKKARPGAEAPCKLCGGPGPLCESHVIPEFVYGPLYNQKHKFLGFKLGPKGVTPELVQKGLREPLLCARCEAHLNTSLEQPSLGPWAAVAGTGGLGLISQSSQRTPQGARAEVLSGFDYVTFKLFLLSILWRANVSSRGEFGDVQLGPHEERIRKMLLNLDAGDPDEYPCLLYLTEPDFHGIFNPWHCRFGSHKGYRFLLGRVLLWFVVSRHFRREEFMKAALTRDGHWLALWMRLGDLPEFRTAVEQVKAVDVPERMLER